MKVAIIKYNAGNIYSVDCAMKRIGVDAIVTDDKEMIAKADKVIFPGVGEAKSTMEYLKHHKLDLLIKDLKQPVLGICIGMQLMCANSEEGDVDCLGIFDAPVKGFKPDGINKIPHMGWNNLRIEKESIITREHEGKFVYYVHSFYVPVNEFTIASTDYIEPFSAALNKRNFYATQFHAEKSGDVGESILKNFINLK